MALTAAQMEASNLITAYVKRQVEAEIETTAHIAALIMDNKASRPEIQKLVSAHTRKISKLAHDFCNGSLKQIISR